MSERTPAIILGGTGYVAGELLRLVLGHPRLALASIVSDGQPGTPVAQAFPHLAAACGDLQYASLEEAFEQVAAAPRSAVLAAAPHGVSHRMLDTLLARAVAAGTTPAVVDISADFRFADAAVYERVYGHPHGAAARLTEFTCALPEHLERAPTPHVAHPGCFSTAALLASVPLLALDLVEPRLYVSAVTGSTGAGRSPIAGTHHPGSSLSGSAIGSTSTRTRTVRRPAISRRAVLAPACRRSMPITAHCSAAACCCGSSIAGSACSRRSARRCR